MDEQRRTENHPERRRSSERNSQETETPDGRQDADGCEK